MPFSRRTPDIPERQWRSHRSRTSCGSAICGINPRNPKWTNRDRFILSNGHASMLLYALLHLAGVKTVDPDYERLGELSVTLDDIKRFRQLDSKCPGHPKSRWTSGIETTTGPLGQGRRPAWAWVRRSAPGDKHERTWRRPQTR